MPDIYIINLKDNRDGHDKNDDKKFFKCKNKHIVAIGWCNEKSRKQSNFKAAKNNLYAMKNGDYVWTRDIQTKNDFYLLKIIDDEVTDYTNPMQECYVEKDIAFSRKVDLVDKFSADDLPLGIVKKDIVARHTLEKVHREFFIKATLNYVDNKKGE